MLNINQNFDLKAPVFNFDRDYFNSVEELNAYDTSNIPDHFVTNVAGMLYLFTDGKWLPMIKTKSNYDNNYLVNFGSDRGGLSLLKGTDNYIYPDTFSLWSEDEKSASFSPGYLSLRGKDDTNYFGIDATEMCITLHDENSGMVGTITTNGCEFKNGDDSTAGSIKILTNKDLTEEEQLVEDSRIDISLVDVHCSADINANRLIYKRPNGSISQLGSGELDFQNSSYQTSVNSTGLSAYFFNDSDDLELGIDIRHDDDKNAIFLGNDYKVGISRIVENTEGATITGVESLTAFTNPSATKVWATDGSTVDLTTKANIADLDAKANKSDVLLKKSASGGYYIELNSHQLGEKAFAANDTCTASGGYSFAEGYDTNARSFATHVEGLNTYAGGAYSHAEGLCTNASGYCSHALGVYNIYHIDAIHSVGIGNASINKNAEYIYAKNNENGTGLMDDPKNGYKYLIGVGGYDGISKDNTTYKSVQEVIADLTARIEQLETLVANCVSISNVDKQTN